MNTDPILLAHEKQPHCYLQTEAIQGHHQPCSQGKEMKRRQGIHWNLKVVFPGVATNKIPVNGLNAGVMSQVRKL